MAGAKPLIIDTGTSTIKAGLAGADAPGLLIPSLVGRPTDPASGLKATYVGNDALHGNFLFENDVAKMKELWALLG